MGLCRDVYDDTGVCSQHSCMAFLLYRCPHTGGSGGLSKYTTNPMPNKLYSNRIYPHY